MAEAGGFEPPVGCPTLVFKTSAFGRSATPPLSALILPRRERRQKRAAPSSGSLGPRFLTHEPRGYSFTEAPNFLWPSKAPTRAASSRPAPVTVAVLAAKSTLTPSTPSMALSADCTRGGHPPPHVMPVMERVTEEASLTSLVCPVSWQATSDTLPSPRRRTSSCFMV